MADASTATPIENSGSVDLSCTFCILLAGGRGTRLHELTTAECAPALWFGQRCRVVDFAMAGLVRAGVRRLVVATQHFPGTLSRHLNEAWAPSFEPGGLQLRDGRASALGTGYRGTADVVRAHIAQIDAAAPREVMVLAGDQVSRLDPAALVEAHRASGAAVTVAALALAPVVTGPTQRILSDAQGRIHRIATRADWTPAPAAPDPGAPDPGTPDPGTPDLVTLGLYVFSWVWLRNLLLTEPDVVHLSADVLPRAVARGVAVQYVPLGKQPFWSRIATLDAYRTTALAFDVAVPPCRLPMVPGAEPRTVPDVRFSRSRFAAQMRTGGLRLLAPLLRAEDRSRWSVIDESVVMPGARIAPGVRLTRCIVAPGTPVPEGLVVGEDAAEDARWFRVTEGGTTLITTAMLSRRAAQGSAFFGFARRRLAASRSV